MKIFTILFSLCMLTVAMIKADGKLHPFQDAARRADLAGVKKNMPWLINFKSDGKTALMYAVQAPEQPSKYEVIEFLLANGARPDILSDDGRSALHMAVAALDFRAVNLLLNDDKAAYQWQKKDLAGFKEAVRKEFEKLVDSYMKKLEDKKMSEADKQAYFQVMTVLLQTKMIDPGADRYMRSKDSFLSVIEAKNNNKKGPLHHKLNDLLALLKGYTEREWEIVSVEEGK